MKPGDRVRTRQGVRGRVLELLEDGRLLVDLPDGPRKLAVSSVYPVGDAKTAQR